MGAARAAGAHGPLRPVDARSALPHRPGRLGARCSESERPAARSTAPRRWRCSCAITRMHGSSWLPPRRTPARRVPLSLDGAHGARRASRSRGASFAHELAAGCGARRRRPSPRRSAELVSAGLVTSDGFAGLRALIADAATRRPATGAGGGTLVAASRRDVAAGAPPSTRRREHAGARAARALRRRRAAGCWRARRMRQPWRVLARVYRRLEARGEIRGGRFVSGLSGEQFALPGSRRTSARGPAHAGRRTR